MADDTDAPLLPRELTIPFPSPILFGGQTWGELQLAEPTVDDLCAVDAYSGVTWKAELVARVAGVPAAVVRAAPITTLNAAFAYLAGWLGAPASYPLNNGATDGDALNLKQ